jgi:hypothetical protein
MIMELLCTARRQLKGARRVHDNRAGGWRVARPGISIADGDIELLILLGTRLRPDDAARSAGLTPRLLGGLAARERSIAGHGDRALGIAAQIPWAGGRLRLRTASARAEDAQRVTLSGCRSHSPDSRLPLGRLSCA